jgi:hypothetical protein
MLPEARRRHHRWLLYLGQCLALGPVGPAAVGGMINVSREGVPPWTFLAGMAVLVAVGVVLWARWLRLSGNFNPNNEDVEARRLYGQSRAILLPQQEAKSALYTSDVPSNERPGLHREGISVSTVKVPRKGPEEPLWATCLGGCILLFLFLVAGISYWNIRAKEIRNQEEMKFQHIGPPPMNPAALEQFRKDNERIAEEARKFEEEMRRQQEKNR